MPAHAGVRLSENKVERIGMGGRHVAHRFDRILEALAATEQTEGRDDGAFAESEGALRRRSRLRGVKGNVGNAVMNDVDFRRIDAVIFAENIFAGLRMHDDRIGAFGDAPRNGAMRVARVGQHGVQRDDRRLFQLFEEIEKPRALGAAEETVLVLYVDQTRVAGVDERSRRAVRSAIVLGQTGHDVGRVDALAAAGLVDRDNLAIGTESLIETRNHIDREGRDPALPWRE